MSPRAAALSMLTVAGVAVGHLVGYAAAHPEQAAREAALGGHAYFAGAASVAVPLGVVAALAWAVRSSRQLGLAGAIPFRTLAAAQVAVFALQELGERAVTGDVAAVVSERGVWLGLVAQLGVAWLVTRAVDAVRRVVRAVRRGERLLPGAVPVAPLAVVGARPSLAPALVAAGPRAPPLPLRT